MLITLKTLFRSQSLGILILKVKTSRIGNTSLGIKIDFNTALGYASGRIEVNFDSSGRIFQYVRFLLSVLLYSRLFDAIFVVYILLYARGSLSNE